MKECNPHCHWYQVCCRTWNGQYLLNKIASLYYWIETSKSASFSCNLAFCLCSAANCLFIKTVSNHFSWLEEFTGSFGKKVIQFLIQRGNCIFWKSRTGIMWPISLCWVGSPITSPRPVVLPKTDLSNSSISAGPDVPQPNTDTHEVTEYCLNETMPF